MVAHEAPMPDELEIADNDDGFAMHDLWRVWVTPSARGHGPSVLLNCGIASIRLAMRYPRTFATFWNQATSGPGR